MKHPTRLKQGKYKFMIYMDSSVDRDLFERFRLLLVQNGVSEANVFRDFILQYMKENVRQLKELDFELTTITELMRFMKKEFLNKISPSAFADFRDRHLEEGVHYFVRESQNGKYIRYMYRADLVQQKLREKYTGKLRPKYRRTGKPLITVPRRIKPESTT